MLHAAYYFEYSFFSFAIDNAGCEILNSYLQAYISGFFHRQWRATWSWPLFLLHFASILNGFAMLKVPSVVQGLNEKPGLSTRGLPKSSVLSGCLDD